MASTNGQTPGHPVRRRRSSSSRLGATSRDTPNIECRAAPEFPRCGLAMHDKRRAARGRGQGAMRSTVSLATVKFSVDREMQATDNTFRTAYMTHLI